MCKLYKSYLSRYIVLRFKKWKRVIPKLYILFQMQDLHLKYIVYTKNKNALQEHQLLMKKLFVYMPRTANTTTTTINSTDGLNGVNYSFKVLFHITTRQFLFLKLKS